MQLAMTLHYLMRSQNPEVSIRTGNIGTSGLGFLGAEVEGELVIPKSISRSIRVEYLDNILSTAQNMPLVLYDAAKQRAWLVPAISIILHMAQI